MRIEALEAQWALAKTDVLPAPLGQFVRSLRRWRDSDPEMAVELAVSALATVRAWVDVEVLLDGARDVGRERLEEWEQQLAAASEDCAILRDAIHDDLHLSLRERNRQRLDLLPEQCSERKFGPHPT